MSAWADGEVYRGNSLSLSLPAAVSPVFLIQTLKQMVYPNFNNFIGNEKLGKSCQK